MSEEFYMPEPQPRTLYQIGGFAFTETMLSAFLVTVLVLVLALVIRLAFIPRWRKSHSIGAFRMVVEAVVTMFDGGAKDKTEHYAPFVGAWYFGVAALIFFGTLMDLVGLRPPVSTLGQTLVLGLSTFVLIHGLGFAKKGPRRLKHYLNPINLITDAVVPFSMALRLFGSVFSGYLVMHLVYHMLPFGTQIVWPAIASVIFTLFHAVIQSYVFMLLSMSFIQEAIETPEGHTRGARPVHVHQPD
ncbi:MAG: F0F1 ATP synthase subunit A [Clostridiales bacterium]|jgi:F-type H+-transporting ATPase subunit a|nr:F0F1 ATP synthase subunit A [Clostridiales bacterium]